MCADVMGMSLESSEQQNGDMCRERPNYDLTRVQWLSTADRTFLTGHAGAHEHREMQGGQLNK